MAFTSLKAWVPKTSVALWFFRVIFYEVQPIEQCDCKQRNTLFCSVKKKKKLFQLEIVNQ